MIAADPTASQPPPSPELEQIFREHHRRVFGAAFRVTGSAQDAEDVLQTVFLRLLRRRGKVDLSPSPGSYLHRAAVNGALDLMRARTRSRSLPLDELASDPPAGPDLDPGRRQDDREIRRHLRQAILALSEKSAQVFSLRFLEGLANRDIAAMLGMTQTAVAVILHRARARVRKEFAASLGDASVGGT